MKMEAVVASYFRCFLPLCVAL